MSYTNHLQFKQRRHPTQRLDPAQAIARLNTIVDDANAQIAKAVAGQRHFEQVAAELAQENSGLRERVATLETHIKRLEKQLSKKAGKKRHAALDEDAWE